MTPEGFVDRDIVEMRVNQGLFGDRFPPKIDRVLKELIGIAQQRLFKEGEMIPGFGPEGSCHRESDWLVLKLESSDGTRKFIIRDTDVGKRAGLDIAKYSKGDLSQGLEIAVREPDGRSYCCKLPRKPRLVTSATVVLLDFYPGTGGPEITEVLITGLTEDIIHARKSEKPVGPENEAEKLVRVYKELAQVASLRVLNEGGVNRPTQMTGNKKNLPATETRVIELLGEDKSKIAILLQDLICGRWPFSGPKLPEKGNEKGLVIIVQPANPDEPTYSLNIPKDPQLFNINNIRDYCRGPLIVDPKIIDRLKKLIQTAQKRV